MEENNESPAPATATPTGPNRNRHFWLLRSIFLLLGVGVLVPWNAFISAKGYFQSRFCDPNDPDNTSTMESTFVFAYTLSSVLSLGMILLGQWAYGYFLQHRRTLVPSTNEEVDGLFLEDGERQDQSAINEGEIDHEVIQNEDEGALQMTPVDDEHVISVDEPSDPHLEHRPTKASSSSMWFDIIPLSLFLLVFCGQTILVLFVGISSPDSIALWTYLSLAICGVCSSLATAGIVAVAGQIQNADLAMNPFLAGQSVGGVIVSMANFAAAVYKDPSNYWNEHCFAAQNQTLHWSDDVSLLADDSDANNGCSGYHEVDWGIFVYFFLGSLVLVGCLLGFSRIEPLRKQLESTTVTEESEDIMRGYQRTGSSLRGVELLRSQEDEQNEPESENISGRPTSQSYLLAGASSEDDADPPSAGMLHAEEDTAPPDDILNVLLLVRGPTACIFLTFVVTLALFPGWTSELASVRQCQIHFRLANDLYTPFSFVLFNIGDLTGRLLAGHVISQRLLSNRLVKASLLRLVFFPLLFLCTGVGMSNPNGPLSLQIHSDVFSLAVQFAFSVSNGMLLTTAFATAPSLLPRDNDKMNERMSEILSFAVAVGLLAGGLCSFPVSRLTE